ncbi:MAG: hypothetical protein AAFP15_02105 [Bacteroidota bacterium]
MNRTLPTSDINDRVTALLGIDGFQLAFDVQEAAEVYGTARADAERAEHERKIVLAEVKEDIRESRARAGDKTTESMLDNLGRASRRYKEAIDHLHTLRQHETQTEAAYYALRNVQEHLNKLNDFARSEMYLERG